MELVVPKLFKQYYTHNYTQFSKCPGVTSSDMSLLFFLTGQRRLSIQMAACSPALYPSTRSACPLTRSAYLPTRWTLVWPMPCHPASTPTTTC